MTISYDAVVLAGGAARRLGGADKPALSVGGRMLLDRVLGACADARSTVVVGPRRPTARPVRWAREDPPGGGPLPALAAGLAALGLPVSPPPPPGTAPRPQGPAESPHSPGSPAAGCVVVLAADLPFLTGETVGALVGALGGGDDGDDGVVLVDAGGRDQPLAAVYRVEALRRELALLGAEHGGLGSLPLRLLTGELALGRIADPTGEASFDCDTWEDVAVARARLDGAAGG